MTVLTQKHQTLIRRAREMYNNIYPCTANHAGGFTDHDGELIFFFNTDDNSTHTVRESRLTAQERILQSCLN